MRAQARAFKEMIMFDTTVFSYMLTAICAIVCVGSVYVLYQVLFADRNADAENEALIQAVDEWRNNNRR